MFIALIFMCLLLAASWALTVGIIFLITLCFGWTFNILVCTGIWLIILLIKNIFGGKN